MLPDADPRAPGRAGGRPTRRSRTPPTRRAVRRARRAAGVAECLGLDGDPARRERRVAGARGAAGRGLHDREGHLRGGSRARRAGARLPARRRRAAPRRRALARALDGERAARARHPALQRAPGPCRDARARLRPARAGRAADRLAPARPARAAAGGLHVARRDGRRRRSPALDLLAARERCGCGTPRP